MMQKQQQLLANPEVRRVYEEEVLFGEATDTIEALLESLEISRSELARRLRVSKGRVSQIMSGAENLTLRTLAAVGWALGVRFELRPVPMVNRAGTPAIADPSPPAWLGHFSDQKRPQGVLTQDIYIPEPVEHHLAWTAPAQARTDREEVLAA